MKNLSLVEKRALIAKIFKTIENSHKFVKNSGTSYFVAMSSGCVQSNINYCAYLEFGILVNILDLKEGYFTGSEAKANILLEAFGGTIKKSEHCYYDEKSCPIFIWESPIRNSGNIGSDDNFLIDLDEAREVLALA